jgi:putative transposase
LIRVGREVFWLWIAIEPKSKSILDMSISLERSILVAEQFLQELIKKYGKNLVSTDGGGTWYLPQACRFLKLRHHTHSYYERSIIENELFNT